MRIAIIGSKAYDSLEYNLHEAFTHAGHECKIFDTADFLLMKNRYGVQIDFLLRRYSDGYDKKLFLKLARKVCEYTPDLVIGVYRFIHPVLVDYVKLNVKCKIIHINPDQMTTLEYQQIFASNYDVWFSKDQYMVDFMVNNMKLNTKHYNEAFNIRLHKKPDATKADVEKEIAVDVMTYGTIYPYRSRMLKQVADAGIQLSIYGTKPHRFYDRSLDSAYKNKYITGEEKSRLLYGAKIVFNQMHYAEIESVNNRFFEVNGSGAFQLSDYRPILKDLLPVDPELVSFRGIDDGVDKIKYYLAHPMERYEIADKIYNHFINHYTYDHLVLYILGNI